MFETYEHGTEHGRVGIQNQVWHGIGVQGNRENGKWNSTNRALTIKARIIDVGCVDGEGLIVGPGRLGGCLPGFFCCPDYCV